jgi:hypothetical protein
MVEGSVAASVRVSPDQLRRITRIVENAHGGVTLRQAVDADFAGEKPGISRQMKRGGSDTIIVEALVVGLAGPQRWAVTASDSHRLLYPVAA